MQQAEQPMNSTALPHPEIGVGAIVFDHRGRVLLIRRGQPPKAGLWSVPGGRLEPGESLAQCCRREALEETGIEVEPGAIVAVADREAEGFRYVIIDFAANLISATVAEPRAATDVSEARWVALPDLSGYALVEGLAAAIAAARASRDAGFQTGLRYSENDGCLFLPVHSGATTNHP